MYFHYKFIFIFVGCFYTAVVVADAFICNGIIFMRIIIIKATKTTAVFGSSKIK